MKGCGTPPWRQVRRCEERIDGIRGELAVGEACVGGATEVWEAVEEELLDELTALELFLLMSHGRRGLGG